MSVSRILLRRGSNGSAADPYFHCARTEVPSRRSAVSGRVVSESRRKPSNPELAVLSTTRFSRPEVTEGAPPWAHVTAVVCDSLEPRTKVEGCGFPWTSACSHAVLAIVIAACETCGLRVSKKWANSKAKPSIVSALLSRAREYTVFFMVSVARIALLSPLTKQLSKSPERRTSTLHSFTLCSAPSRCTFITRTLDFP